jgi:protein TonB
MKTLQPGDRLAAAFVTAGLVALLLWALVVGLAIGTGRTVDDALKLFGVVPPVPPPAPEVEPPPQRNFRPTGRAAPPNLRSKPTEVVAPEPVVVTPPLPTVVVAPVAGPGVQASAGAADVPGPGTGAGGEGDGFGAGGSGDGDGAGDVPPRRIGGRLRDSDYPLEAGEQGVGGTVGVRFVVDIRGRVPSCRVTRSSGSPLLDETTCRLIMQRYRYRPAQDAQGRPFTSVIVQNESWIVREEEEE